MTLKTPKAALLAAILSATTAPAVLADMVIIQQGPSAGFMPNVQIQNRPTSGFNMAADFVTNLAADRMPGFNVSPQSPVQILQEPVYDEIGFAGDWRMTEAPGLSDADLNESDAPDVTFSIAADGQFSAYAGCNQIFGTLHQQGGALVDPGVGMTMMACFGLVGDQERALANALDNAAMFAHAGDILVFLDAEGEKLAEFHSFEAH